APPAAPMITRPWLEKSRPIWYEVTPLGADPRSEAPPTPTPVPSGVHDCLLVVCRIDTMRPHWPQSSVGATAAAVGFAAPAAGMAGGGNCASATVAPNAIAASNANTGTGTLIGVPPRL